MPELRRHLRRCSELRTRLAVVYRRARRIGIMRNDMKPGTAALGTCVFIAGLIRLWLMDRDAKVLRKQADALIGAHVAALRRIQR